MDSYPGKIGTVPIGKVSSPANFSLMCVFLVLKKQLLVGRVVPLSEKNDFLNLFLYRLIEDQP